MQTSKALSVLFLVPVLLALTVSANAGVTSTCAAGEAPGGWGGWALAACSPPEAGSIGLTAPVCREDASGFALAWECDLTRNGNFHAADSGYTPTATIVTDFTGTGSPTFSAWGYADNGVPFCCTYRTVDNELVERVEIIGTDDHDILSFQYGPNQLEPPLTNGTFAMEGWARSANGDDVIFGSPFWNATRPYFDTLLAGDGADQVFGLAGADWLYGGGGDDVLFGGSGIDTIYGQEGNDWVEAGPGSDLVFGGSDNDVLRGDGGRDELHGESGSDVICDGGSGDELHGGAGLDVLWYRNGGASPPGPSSNLASSSGSSLCGHAAWGSGWAGSFCSYTLTVEPAACR